MVLSYYFSPLRYKYNNNNRIFKIMEEKKQKMVPKYHYDQMEKATRLKLRDEFLRRSGMSLITFYDKLRKDSFKPLERELYENIFIIQQN